MDLPVWQALYEELAPQNFTVVTVAMDAGGAQDVRQWIEAAKPTHPSLIDTRHVVAELYDWVNVPSNAWIDEEGRIVRPNDPGFAGEYFRGMMDPDFDFKAMMKEYGRMRDRYLDAVRDWVAHGPGSRCAPGQMLSCTRSTRAASAWRSRDAANLTPHTPQTPTTLGARRDARLASRRGTRLRRRARRKRDRMIVLMPALGARAMPRLPAHVRSVGARGGVQRTGRPSAVPDTRATSARPPPPTRVRP